MKVDRLGVVLDVDEERYAVLRAAPRAYALRTFFGIVWMLTPFFFFFPLLRLQLIGGVGGALVAVSGILFLLQLRASWYGSALVLTNQRCIDVMRRGFRPPTVTAVAWEDIEKIVVTPGRLGQRLMGLANIRVDLRTAPHLSLLLLGVRRAELVRKLVDEVHCQVNGRAL